MAFQSTLATVIPLQPSLDEIIFCFLALLKLKQSFLRCLTIDFRALMSADGCCST